MFSTAAAAQVFEKGLTPVKGWYVGFDNALDKAAKFSSTALGLTAFPGGRVATLSSAGEFDLGGGNQKMPMYLFNGQLDPSIQNSGVSPTTGTTYWKSVFPKGVAVGLVPTGGYELQTTEYNTSLTYAPNQLLTTMSTSGNEGKLTNASVTPYVTWVCGVTSFGTPKRTIDSAPTGPVTANAYKVPVLTFWSYFLPSNS